MSMPSKGNILLYWKDWLIENDYIVDEYEPSCWACGYFYGDNYDVKGDDFSDEQLKKAWNKVPFQRCHIVPKSLGGSDDVSNLFLMCQKCHDLAPDSTSKEIFLNWAKNQNFYTREIAVIKKCIQDFGLTVEEHMELFYGVDMNELLEWIKTEKFNSMIGSHFGQLNGGRMVKTSTFMAALIKYARLNEEGKL